MSNIFDLELIERWLDPCDNIPQWYVHPNAERVIEAIDREVMFANALADGWRTARRLINDVAGLIIKRRAAGSFEGDALFNEYEAAFLTAARAHDFMEQRTGFIADMQTIHELANLGGRVYFLYQRAITAWEAQQAETASL